MLKLGPFEYFISEITEGILVKFWNLRAGRISLIESNFVSCQSSSLQNIQLNPLNAELNPICYLLALLAHRSLHVSRIRVKSLTLRLLMSYIYI